MNSSFTLMRSKSSKDVSLPVDSSIHTPPYRVSTKSSTMLTALAFPGVLGPTLTRQAPIREEARDESRFRPQDQDDSGGESLFARRARSRSG